MIDLHEQTTPAVGEPAPSSTGRSVRFWLPVVLLAVGALVLGVLIGAMIGGGDDDSAVWGPGVDDATLDEIDTLLDDYWAGWENADGDTVTALMTEDGWFRSDHTSEAGYTGDYLARYVDRWEYIDFSRVGPTTVVASIVGYEVVGVERVENYWPEPRQLLDHFWIISEDGELRIASHEVITKI